MPHVILRTAPCETRPPASKLLPADEATSMCPARCDTGKDRSLSVPTELPNRPSLHVQARSFDKLIDR